MHVPCTKISRVMMEKQYEGRDYSAPMPWTRLAWSRRYGSTSIECRRYLSHLAYLHVETAGPSMLILGFFRFR